MPNFYKQPETRSRFYSFLLAILLILSPLFPGRVNIALANDTSLWGFSFGGFVSSMLAQLAQIVFSAVAWIVAQIGYLLDYTVEVMVLEMADIVNDISAIDTLWSTFRDLGNIVFIGVLLYIAIRTILNVGNDFNTKRILVRLVIVALFVNFSLFATKVVIDTSNVVALQFYNSIQVEDCGESACNISHFFADVTNISSVQSPAAIEAIENGGSTEDANFKILIARILGIIFLLVTGFVMAAMAFLLLVRFGFLILLMVASPLAFIAFVLPSTSSMGERWMQTLFSQSFFAPILFAMIYVVAVLGFDLASGLGGNGDLMAAILDPDGDNYGVILTFILMTVLMASTLVVAKQMGAAGASGTIKIAQKARNAGQAKLAGAGRSTVGAAAGTAAWAGRSTAGRMGQRMANSARLKEQAAQGGAAGWIAQKKLNMSEKVADSSFDVRNTKTVGDSLGSTGRRDGGYRQVLEDKEKKREEEKKKIESLSSTEKADAEGAKLQKDKLKDQKENIDKKIKSETSDVNKFINKRNQIQNKLAEAGENQELKDNLNRQLKDLTNQVKDKVRGVDDIDDLEERRDVLDGRKKAVQGAFKQQNKELDKIINVGKERGEKFTEVMLTQKSMLDRAREKLSKYAAGDMLETTSTKGNRNMAVGSLGDVKNKKRKRRISREITESGRKGWRKQDIKESNAKIDQKIDEIQDYIGRRDDLRQRLSEAQQAQDSQLQKDLIKEFKNLNNEVKNNKDINTPEDLDALESQRDKLKNKKEKEE